MIKTNYEKGKSWAHAIFKSQIELEGEIGVRKTDKARATCEKYAKNKQLKTTHNGKELNPKTRDFYKGAADGFQEFYNEHFS